MAATEKVSKLATKKINNVKCQMIPHDREEDKRPIKGYEMIPNLYANIFLCAKKNKGKTTVIWNIINRCAGRDTVIVAFVSTLNNDASWIKIREKCEERGLPFIGFTGIMSPDGDQLEALVESLQKKAGDEVETKEEKATGPAPTSIVEYMPIPTSSGSGTAEKPPRKLPYRAPEYMIIMDDLSAELKKQSVAALLKKNRHFKTKVIISSQWLNDLPPEALRQINIMCLFEGFSISKLEEFHKKANLGVPLLDFIEMYNDATKEPFGFLYVDTDTSVYRNKFDQQYRVPE